MRLLTLAVVFVALSFPLCAQTSFHWKWQGQGDSLTVTGYLDGESKNISVSRPLGLTRQRFVRLYYIIDEIEYGKLSLYRNTADTLNKLLVEPFADGLAKCTDIVVETDSTLLNFTLEFLSFNKIPLAVFKPMVFTINGFAAHEQGKSRFPLQKGFIVRDRTSDPEKDVSIFFINFRDQNSGMPAVSTKKTWG